MTPKCDLKSGKGWCYLPQGHRGEHRTSRGETFTYEEAMQGQLLVPEAEAAEPEKMNRSERRADKKAKRLS